MAAKKVTEMTLEERLKASVAMASAPSLIPQKSTRTERHHGAEIEVEVLPDLREVIEDRSVQAEVISLTDLHTIYSQAEKEAAAEKAKCVTRLKQILGKEPQGFMVGDVRVRTYFTPRSSIKADKLLANGVAPAVIAACTETTQSLTLKITPPSDKED